MSVSSRSISASRSSSIERDDESFEATSQTPPPPFVEDQFQVTNSLEDLQTEEQRRVLNTVSELRKCGLESVLPLPQLVVCGDQSAGKSSVLEALTEIPFPRNDNLCTRFATEISLRNAPVDALTVKIIPDNSRPAAEQSVIRQFVQTITNFDDLPGIMDMAMNAMGITADNDDETTRRAFSRDVLSIAIDGPTRPHLTLVDLPGLIASATKEASDADVETVAQITEHYISQSRTICLAVISAKNDVANQQILKRVRKHDPEGQRTLGIITKPDTLDAGSGNEKAFISLAKNENVKFKLGWHVVRNRKYEEMDCSLLQRNSKENSWFRTSNFKVLPKDTVGVEKLRTRLAALLFEHVKKELPKLRSELENQLAAYEDGLATYGDSRSTAVECRAYLVQLSTEVQKICAAAIEGHYEGKYFQCEVDKEFKLGDKYALARTRAVVQKKNMQFADLMRLKGHKYHIDMTDQTFSTRDTPKAHEAAENGEPEELTKEEGLDWIQQAINRTRGKELMGDINPLLVSELFWEQASKWEQMAEDHTNDVYDQCAQFLQNLLRDKVPKDVETRLWSALIEDTLNDRSKAARQELSRLIEDLQNHPINYNHYYTDNINRRRKEKEEKLIEQCLQESQDQFCDEYGNTKTGIDQSKLRDKIAKSFTKDPERFGCEDALDRLLAIYKVLQKVFIANVTTQVVERHIVRGLDKIFDPIAVNKMSDDQVAAIASEPLTTRREREYLVDQIENLRKGKRIFRSIMGGGVTL
ncbi:interferon-induced GTP-binding Mx protein [Rutstroemia sp. NJR-2017a BBW]|nr:interferon-induced GTP-binding Mx protein [Rutstroemia sp. NJR-2017a BBW]